MEAFVLILILVGAVAFIVRLRMKDTRYMNLPYSPRLPKNLRPRVEGESSFDQTLSKALGKAQSDANRKEPS